MKIFERRKERGATPRSLHRRDIDSIPELLHGRVRKIDADASSIERRAVRKLIVIYAVNTIQYFQPITLWKSCFIQIVFILLLLKKKKFIQLINVPLHECKVGVSKKKKEEKWLIQSTHD